MDRLPIECLFHVMRFCDVRQVYVCMSVSQKWESAARSQIKTREALVIHPDDRMRKQMDHMINDLDIIPRYEWSGPFVDTLMTKEDEVLVDQVYTSLAEFVNLKVLLIGIRTEPVKEIIGRNCNTLQVLWVDGELPVPPDGRLYPNLVHVNCRGMSPVAAKSCPRLKQVSLFGQLNWRTLQSLPADELQSLECDFCGSLSSEAAIPGLVQGIKSLSQLRVLKLKISSHDWSDRMDSLNNLFDGMTHLTRVKLDIGNDEVLMDKGVLTLVRQNPLLNRLTLRCMTLTDEALTSLSQLQHLSRVKLDSEEAEYSLDVIVSFLRGSSRSVMTRFSIWHQTESDWSSVKAEAELMAQEAGKSLDFEIGGDWCRFSLS